MVVGSCTLGGRVEADIDTWLLSIVVGRQIDDFGADDTALRGTIFVVAGANRLVGLAIGHVAPKDTVVVFVLVIFVEDAAHTFGGEVHHDVAVVGGESASGVHGAGVFGGVVVDDTILEDRLRVIIKVYAATFGGSDVVADAAVGVVDAESVADATAHRSVVALDVTVIQVDMSGAACRVDVNATPVHGSGVLLYGAVRQRDIVVQVGTGTASSVAVFEGEAVPDGGRG